MPVLISHSFSVIAFIFSSFALLFGQFTLFITFNDGYIKILTGINWFTSLCKKHIQLEFLAEAFRCHVHHFQCLTVPMEPSSIENDAHGIEKLLLKTQVSWTCFLHSEVNQLIQHIIMKVQDSKLWIFLIWIIMIGRW